MARREPTTFVEDLSRLPWWLCLALGALLYVALRFGLPLIEFDNPILVKLRPEVVRHAWVLPLLFVFGAVHSALRSLLRGEFLRRRVGARRARPNRSAAHEPTPPAAAPAPTRQHGAATAPTTVSLTRPAAPPSCPMCGAAMVERTARRGPNVGRRFLGCTRFPACRGTRRLA